MTDVVGADVVRPIRIEHVPRREWCVRQVLHGRCRRERQGDDVREVGCRLGEGEHDRVVIGCLNPGDAGHSCVDECGSSGRALRRIRVLEGNAECLVAHDRRDVVARVSVRSECRIAVAQDPALEILRGDRPGWRRVPHQTGPELEGVGQAIGTHRRQTRRGVRDECLRSDQVRRCGIREQLPCVGALEGERDGLVLSLRIRRGREIGASLDLQRSAVHRRTFRVLVRGEPGHV